MEKTGYESFYLAENELLVLLAGKGVKSWYGLSLGINRYAETEFFEKWLYPVLAKLYQKGYVDWEDGMVAIREPIDSMINGLANAAFCMTAEKAGSQKKICYFIPQGAVLLEKSQREADMLRLTCLDKEEFLSELWEEGYFPENGVWVGDCRFHFHAVSDGRLVESIKLEEDGLLTWIVLEAAGECRRFSYEEEWCRKKIQSFWMRGAKKKTDS
ncbi:MAG: hypothetical protein Q4F21_10905 [Lachnospiraceae bacterium]|nr:hypothetical protein [Lachnospiraceae bacterium]